MKYEELHGRSIRKAFQGYLKDNPDVYITFENQVFKAIRAGKNKISAKLVINWMRWNEFVSGKSDKTFKINDAFQSYFAREFVKRNPQHKDVFNFRKLRNEVPGPYMETAPDGTQTFL